MNPEPHVIVLDELNPQDLAMLQALYSRSAESVDVHIDKVKKSGSGKFMESFYVGYGHKSIADCGSTTLFLEGVSILAAKAVQDWSLYSGQETSTRYIDMSKQPIIDPVGTEASAEVLKRWMDFYTSNQDAVAEHLTQMYPRKSDEDEKTYGKAIKARVFDIMRSFLPSGITTQLSWHTNLRQAADKLAMLRHHPVPEIRDLGLTMLQKLQERFPNSFSHKLYEEQEEYRAMVAKEYTYYNPATSPKDVVCTSTLNLRDLTPYLDVLMKRPVKTDVPHFLAECGTLTFEFLLDFGSFRDLQRHRNGVCRMPLVTTKFGFHSWYLNQLPLEVRQRALDLIAKQTIAIEELQTTPEQRQYYIAMGFQVPCKVTYGLPAAIYVIELRSGKLVHPTLRAIAHGMHHALCNQLVPLHTDMQEDDWDVRRGLQDIVAKPQNSLFP